MDNYSHRVLVRRESIDLPTYQTHPERPDPSFTKRLGAHVYPYRLQNRLTGRRVSRRYETLVLENELLRLTFLPDLGCRLFSVYDKLLGREVFYRNDCIKPTLIATRGAWISGGIEFNFPVSHSVYTHSRIPHTMRRFPDGSAAVVFGLTEQMTGMRFTVEIRLAPREYRFSDHIRLYNGTSLPHRHYWWTNAGVSSTPDMRLIYPMTRCVSGAYGENTTWPVCDGKDLSRMENHEFTGDVFAAETYDEFFGVYYDVTDYGLAHWARQEEMPARKVFCWGQDAMGKLWQSMLTDNAGDYMEIQAGRFATQGDFDLLQPHELVEMTEYWLPVGPTGGFVKAHREGIINTGPDGMISVQMCRDTTAAEIRVSLGDKHLASERHDLRAGEVVSLNASGNPQKVSVVVLDAARNVLLAYDPRRTERVRDVVPRTSLSREYLDTPDDVLDAARTAERHDSSEAAIKRFEKLIGTDHEPEARKGLARFALRAGRWGDAGDQARTVIRPDSESEALLALSIEGLGDDASDRWTRLISDPSLGVLARCRLAGNCIRSGDCAAVANLVTNSADPLLSLLGAIAARILGKKNDKVSALVEADPLWRHALWESFFSSQQGEPPPLAIESFQEDMDAAAMYLELGRGEEARSIADCWVEAVPPCDPFLRVLLEELDGEPPRAYGYDEWGVVSCFAHGDVLMRLLENRSDKESLIEYGNMLYDRGRTDEAVGKWLYAYKSEPSDYRPCRNLAIAYWHKLDDLSAAFDFMRRASDLCPDNPSILRDLDILAELSGEEAIRSDIARRILLHAPDDSECLERAVRAHLAADELDEAVEILANKNFFVAELAYQTRILYVWAMVRRGLRSMDRRHYTEASRDFRAATEYPTNLGASRFHDSSDAQAFCLHGDALTCLGDSTGARSAYGSAADDMPIRGTEQAYYVGRARDRLARHDARDAYAMILPANPSADSPEAEARLNMLRGLDRLACGDPDAASEFFRRAREFERDEPLRMRRYMEQVAHTRAEGRRVPIAVWQH
ncbi:MAG: DUF5107 domain-containing protein [Armatimonadetes bacterium]|nr:DUF5107 domain-containing protein [Armatimonadota bacterium]